MKDLLFGAVFLFSFTAINLANACDAGELCKSKAALFEDLIKNRASFAPACPDFTYQEALLISQKALSSQISYTNFKLEYAKTCIADVKAKVISSERKAEVLTEYLIKYTRDLPSNCPTLSALEATSATNLVLGEKISLEGFKNAYKAYCDFNKSITISATKARADIVLDISNYISLLPHNCPYITVEQGVRVADLIVINKISLEGFKNAYKLYCNFDNALIVSTTKTKSDIVININNYIAQLPSDCLYLTIEQSVQAADLVIANKISLDIFKNAYKSFCEFNSSLSVASSKVKYDIAMDIRNYTYKGKCGLINPNNAADLSGLVFDGKVNYHDFKSVYETTCDYAVSVEASRCL